MCVKVGSRGSFRQVRDIQEWKKSVLQKKGNSLVTVPVKMYILRKQFPNSEERFFP